MEDIKKIIAGFNHIITQIIEINDQIANLLNDHNEYDEYELQRLLNTKSTYQSEARGAWYILLTLDKISYKEYLYIARHIENAQIMDYASYVETMHKEV